MPILDVPQDCPKTMLRMVLGPYFQNGTLSGPFGFVGGCEPGAELQKLWLTEALETLSLQADPAERTLAARWISQARGK